MRVKVVYIFRPKENLLPLLVSKGMDDLRNELCQSKAWLTEEPDTDTYHDDRMIAIKELYVKALRRDFQDLSLYLEAPVGEADAITFDRFWTAEWVEVDREVRPFDPIPQ